MDHAQVREVLRRFARMFAGFIIMGFACAMQVQANLGFGSWTVLDHGLTRHFPLTIGTASILTSAAIIVLDLMAGEKIGVGMPFNMVVIGILIDVFLAMNLVPAMPGLWGPGGSFSPAGTAMSVAMLFASIVLISYSTCLYMSAGLGAGPRDTLMVAAMKITGKDIAICRNTLELTALGVGWLLGGSVGVGTVMVALLSGPVMQVISRAMKFNPKTVRHIHINELHGVLTGTIRLEGTPAANPDAEPTPACCETGAEE